MRVLAPVLMVAVMAGCVAQNNSQNSSHTNQSSSVAASVVASSEAPSSPAVSSQSLSSQSLSSQTLSSLPMSSSSTTAAVASSSVIASVASSAVAVSSQVASNPSSAASSVTTKAGVIFEDNFETAAAMTLPQPWVASTGIEASLAEQVVIARDKAFSGEQALKIKSSGGNAFAFVHLPTSAAQSPALYIRYYLHTQNKIGQSGGNRSSFLKMGPYVQNKVYNDGRAEGISFGEAQGTFGATAASYSNATNPRQFSNGNNAIAANVWQCVEISLEAQAVGQVAGRITLAVDGQTIHTLAASNANDWQQVWQNGPPASDWLSKAFAQSVGLGWDSASNQANALFIDDLVISTEPVGCSYLPGGLTIIEDSSSSEGSTSSAPPPSFEPDPKCGGDIIYCEDFNSTTGQTLPAGLSFVKCNQNEGGSMEMVDTGLNGSRAVKVSNFKGYCGSAIDTNIIRQMERGYARFYVREQTEGNSLRMLMWLEDGPMSDRNGYSWRLRINGKDIHWNRADVGDTVAPDFSADAIATTTKVNSAEWNCMEVFWDNNIDVIQYWYNDKKILGLEIDPSLTGDKQLNSRWFRDHPKPYDMDLKMVRVGHDGANAGSTIIDNIAVSESRIGCGTP